MEYDPESEHSDEAQIQAFWNLARLRWLLDDHQLLIYDAYRAWEPGARKTLVDGKRTLNRVFIALCGRQVGKTHVGCTIRTEDCMRRPNSLYRYITALQQDITEIVIPNMETILETCPPHLRPEYRDSSKGRNEGYYFPNGSVLRLVGLDKNPKGVRGRTCDGDSISEAGFMANFSHNVASVLYPQYLRRPWARMFIETSAPEDENHDIDKVFIPDAMRRKAYVELTIDDNKALDEETKGEFLDAAYAANPEIAEREYRNKRVRNTVKTIIPEFDAPTIQKPNSRHIAAFERPEYAVAMAAMDPGMRDLMALLWGYWDARAAKLCIEDEWARRNATTATVADVIYHKEVDLYGGASVMRDGLRPPRDSKEDLEQRLKELVDGKPKRDPSRFGLTRPDGLCYWDGQEFRGNPIHRVSDTNARMIGDLTVSYGIQVMNTHKDDKEAALFALRDAFRFDKIVIHPRCVKLIEHLTAGRWNDKRTDYQRTEDHGHFDLVDALVYLWRMIQPIRAMNPYPPHHFDPNAPDVLIHRVQPAHGSAVDSMRAALGTSRSGWRGRA